MKINFLLIFSITLFSINLNANRLDSIQEVFPYENPEYIGYRLALTNIKVTPSKDEHFLNIEYIGVNTGRKDLLFEETSAPPPSLVVTYDQTLRDNNLVPFAKEIRDEIIMKSNFFVAAGKLTETQTIQLNISGSANKVIANQKTEVENLDNPRYTDKTIKEEKLTAKAVPLDDFENSLMSSSSKSLALKYDENACSDLIFESIKVIKKSKSKVTLKYTIINQGLGPATLINNRKKEEHNMALSAYMSSRDKVTKSSFSFDGDFIGKGLDKTNGKLYPGESYTNTIKLNIQKMTKFTPYIILELDPYLSVRECDKKNNKLGVKVGEGVE